VTKKTSCVTTKKNCDEQNRPVFTSGKIFPDHAVLELVRPSADNEPSLLYWRDGQEPVVGAQVERDGAVYQPIAADGSVWSAMALPGGLVDRGSSADLFGEIGASIEKFVGFSSGEAALLTAWIVTTWFADTLLNPPILLLHGSEMSAAVKVLRLLGCLCRHALILATISLVTLRSLIALQPTFLLNQPELNYQLRGLWAAFNHRDLLLPTPEGSVVSLVSSKAILVGTNTRTWTDAGIHLFLPPARSELAPLDANAKLDIQDRFQPWLLSHRLNNLQAVSQSRFGSGDSASPMSDLARMLKMCTLDDDRLAAQWLPLLDLRDQDDVAQHLWDPVAAMLEVLWPLMHSLEDSISMGRPCELTNTLLSSRGELREYSREELGIKLKTEGVFRRRRNSGMVLVFDRPTRRRLHQMARSVGVGKRVAACPDCEELQIRAE